jgi:hypothetical protein
MTEETEDRSASIGIGLSIQVSLMNVGRRIPSEQVSRYLKEELPVRAVFVRRLPPPGAPMGLGDELILVLNVGASIVTLATALVGIYRRFVKSNLRESKHGTPGVHVEIRNANNDFALLTVTSEDPEVVISTLKERIRVVTSNGDGDGQQVEATIERSQSWIKIR